ncbi:MAG: twin-arginine translocase TatA/TatE family subunit [Rhodospirillaceae bacterium]|nr:twin-arginine translocase TatA/TatE family subunit [Rhodospirillaceae bacterium]|tara:strand:+ start:704 stop:949 length:246 start_codon:yes stop_codon:yes gene_type:complete
MGFTSIWHWVIVLIIVVILFGGRGKLSSLMGDLGTGLRNFKRGMNKDGDEEANEAQSKQIEVAIDSPADKTVERNSKVKKN